jgi:hypothetical protein
MREGLKHPSERPRKYLRLSVPGLRSGTAPGIASVVGEPLRVGTRIHISGRGTRSTVLTVITRSGDRRYRLTAPYGALSPVASINASLTVTERHGQLSLTIRGSTVRAKVTRIP